MADVDNNGNNGVDDPNRGHNIDPNALEARMRFLIGLIEAHSRFLAIKVLATANTVLTQASAAHSTTLTAQSTTLRAQSTLLAAQSTSLDTVVAKTTAHDLSIAQMKKELDDLARARDDFQTKALDQIKTEVTDQVAVVKTNAELQTQAVSNVQAIVSTHTNALIHLGDLSVTLTRGQSIPKFTEVMGLVLTGGGFIAGLFSGLKHSVKDGCEKEGINYWELGVYVGILFVGAFLALMGKKIMKWLGLRAGAPNPVLPILNPLPSNPSNP